MSWRVKFYLKLGRKILKTFFFKLFTDSLNPCYTNSRWIFLFCLYCNCEFIVKNYLLKLFNVFHILILWVVIIDPNSFKLRHVLLYFFPIWSSHNQLWRYLIFNGTAGFMCANEVYQFIDWFNFLYKVSIGFLLKKLLLKIPYSSWQLL